MEGEPKKNYTEGEIFDKGEMKVFAVYNDGARYDVTEHATYPTGNMSIDMTTVTIGFGGQTKTIDGIVVEPAATPALNGIELSGEYKTAYRIGEKIDLAGLVVTAKYTAGKADEVVTNYSVKIKDSEASVADTYLTEGTTTLVVTYSEGDDSFEQEIEITVTLADTYTVATTSKANYVFVTYAQKANAQYTYSVMEFYGDLTSGGTYVATISYTKNSWTKSFYFVYVGSYKITNGNVKIGVPQVLKVGETSTTMVYSDSHPDKETIVENGGFDATITTEKNVSTITFATTANVITSKFFGFDAKVNKVNVPVVCYQVVNGTIPTEVQDALPDTLKKS